MLGGSSHVTPAHRPPVVHRADDASTQAKLTTRLRHQKRLDESAYYNYGQEKSADDDTDCWWEFLCRLHI